MSEAGSACSLCGGVGGTLVWADTICRVVLADESDIPGYCKVVLSRHAAELSALTPPERVDLLETVVAVESAVLASFLPDKINLASLGNLVPHLHWHVIPRWKDDRWFPRPIWAEPIRVGTVRTAQDGFADALRARLDAWRRR